jgi:AcrR family transcriptional regulator
MQQPAVETRFERRRRESRRRLLQAARELFAAQGLHETSISQIAARADLGLGTFYLHFDSKDEVLAAIVEDDLELLLSRIAEATAGTGSAAQRHRIGTRIYLEYAHAHCELFRILFEQVPQSHAVLRGVRERWVEATTRLLQEGIAQGEVRTANTELLARTLVAIVGQAALWWTEHEAPGPAAIADTVSTFIEQGLTGSRQ